MNNTEKLATHCTQYEEKQKHNTIVMHVFFIMLSYLINIQDTNINWLHISLSILVSGTQH